MALIMSTNPDRNQSFYHLACIQSVSLGLPVIIIGKQFAEAYGVGVAICSIFLGNLILWLIGLSIISTVYYSHTNAIENIKGYFGKIGAGIFAVILVFAFLDWYAMQIKSTLVGLESIIQYRYQWEEGLSLRVGAVLGVFSAVFSVGGIRFLKCLTTALFIPVIIYVLLILAMADKTTGEPMKWGLSFPATVVTVLTLLPGVINLPTFFRHSRSRFDSYLALTVMTFVITFIECASVWIDFSSVIRNIPLNANLFIVLFICISTSLFLLVTSICSNLLNVYLASACYESFIPKFEGAKGYAIMGLLGTVAFTFIQVSWPIEFIENLFNCYVAVLGVILLISSLARIVIKHRPRTAEKSINLIGWIGGCTVGTISLIKNPEQFIEALSYSSITGFFFLLIVFFIEENIWAIQKLHIKNQSSIR